MLVSHPLLSVILLCAGADGSSAASDIFTQRKNVTEALWPMVATAGQRLVGSYELDVFFSKYDPLSIEVLYLLEKEFVTDPKSWIRDFADLGVTYEYARAYFRSLDVYKDEFYPRLTYEDMDDIIDISESLTGGSGLGLINRNQFRTGFNEGVLRGVSIMLLFVRFNSRQTEHSQLIEQLSFVDFRKIHKEMDRDESGHVNIDEMKRFWTEGGYGPSEYAALLHAHLDLDIDGKIYIEEWDIVFHDLDCRDGDWMLDTEELWQLDMMVHYERFIGGECTLRREYFEFLYRWLIGS